MLKKIYVPKPGNSSMIGIMSRVGSRQETDKIKGISHFIEHLCFKGTKNRTCKEIGQAIEKYGGDLNAFTDTEITCYWAKIANEHLDHATEVITDLVTNPIFPEKEINKEREVVIQELKMYEDDPKDSLWDFFHRTYFTKKSQLHTSVIGTIKTLRQITRKDILNYYNKYYKDLTLIVVGNTNHYSQTQDISRRFPLSVQTAYRTDVVSKFETRKNIMQANIMLGGYNMSINGITNDMFSLMLLDSIYNDMSGRLFSKVREQNNLCYRIKFGSDVTSDGLVFWEVTVGLEKDKINFAKKIILEELNRPFTKIEIADAVQKTLGQWVMSLDNISTVFHTVAFSELKKINYRNFLYNYKENLIKASKRINDFRERMIFKKNLIVGVLPK